MSRDSSIIQHFLISPVPTSSGSSITPGSRGQEEISSEISTVQGEITSILIQKDTTTNSLNNSGQIQATQITQQTNERRLRESKISCLQQRLQALEAEYNQIVTAQESNHETRSSNSGQEGTARLAQLEQIRRSI